MKEILTPRDVAAMFGVIPKTVSRWADAGKIPSFRTPGGHRRFRRSELLGAAMAAGEPAARLDPAQPTLEEAVDASD